MALIIGSNGSTYTIQKITGNQETKKFLNSLGFVVGEVLTIISKNGDNIIVNIKNSRIALGATMASRIIII